MTKTPRPPRISFETTPEQMKGLEQLAADHDPSKPNVSSAARRAVDAGLRVLLKGRKKSA